MPAQAATTLAGFQKRFLRKRAHGLRPLVRVGDAGVSDALVRALRQALLDHELVKVRLHSPEDKKADALLLAERSDSVVCGIVGHTVILYAPHPETPHIELPTREG